jgi:protein required for attachment to host cells
MKKPRLWYVIADGGRARFVARDEQGAFRTLSSFVSTELHKSSRELGRDRPARVKESASPARSAVEPRRDLHEAAKEDFIRTVADTLAADLDDGKFDRLVLVAPPGVIAELRGALSKPASQLVVDELQKDLTKVPDHDLAAHLSPE